MTKLNTPLNNMPIDYVTQWQLNVLIDMYSYKVVAMNVKLVLDNVSVQSELYIHLSNIVNSMPLASFKQSFKKVS